MEAGSSGSHSIVRRLLIGLTLAVGIVSALSILLIVVIGLRNGEAELESEVDKSVSHLAQILNQPLWDCDTERTASIGEVYSRDRRIVQMKIREAAGKTLFSVERGDAGAITDAVQRTVQINRGGNPLGEFRVSFSRAAYRQRVWEFVFSTMLVGLVAMLAGSVTIIFLIRNVLNKPLERLTRIVNAYSAGDYAQKVDSIPYIEFERFGTVLSDMGGKIRLQVNQLQEFNNRLESMYNQMEKITAQVPGVVYQFKQKLDGGYCIPYASAGIRRVFRLAPEDVRDDATLLFDTIHPDDRSRVIDSIRTSANTLKPWQNEYRVCFPDGMQRWLYGSAIPEKQQDGSILWHGFVSDITERKQIETAKASLEAQLLQAQKVESIGRLAGGVAHDFNNLLTSIMGFSEIALLTVPKDSKAAKSMRRVIEAANRGGGLTQQLLAFARKKIVKPEVVDLNRVVSGIEPMLHRLIGEDIELVFTPGRNLGSVKVDVGSIEQVIMNMVVNARDAMPKGGKLSLETASVRLGADYTARHLDVLPGEYILFSVTDTGTGMSEETRARIFEPFFTTKPVGQGTGLGLAMCHGIVKQAGGHISVYSEPGRGSTFKIYLPHSESGAAVEAEKRHTEALQSGTETILLVEDDDLIREFATQVLESLGYRVIVAANGEIALKMAASCDTKIDLLLTDVVMPKMGGRDLADKLKSLRPGIKVLFASGYTANAIVHHGVLDEGIDFIEKPYNVAMLAEKVRAVLERK